MGATQAPSQGRAGKERGSRAAGTRTPAAACRALRRASAPRRGAIDHSPADRKLARRDALTCSPQRWLASIAPSPSRGCRCPPLASPRPAASDQGASLSPGRMQGNRSDASSHDGRYAHGFWSLQGWRGQAAPFPETARRRDVSCSSAASSTPLKRPASRLCTQTPRPATGFPILNRRAQALEVQCRAARTGAPGTRTRKLKKNSLFHSGCSGSTPPPSQAAPCLQHAVWVEHIAR